MRIVLYVGKGGVGKTTVAAATAARAAHLGHRAVVVSTDIAHSLGDVLEHDLTHEPTEVAKNLYAQEINVLEDLRDYWGTIHVYLAGMLRKRGYDEVVAEEMATIPGMDEVVSLLHMWKNAGDPRFDVMVIDAAPTGETIRLLSMPETFDWYANRLGGWNSGPTKVAANLMRGVVPEADFFGLLTSLQGDLVKMRGALIDPDVTSFRLVVNPERVVIKEARRAETYLNLFGYPIDAVVCNRVMPDTGEIDAFRRRTLERERAALTMLEETFSLPLFKVARHADEPVGVRELAKFGHDIYGGADPTAVFHRGATQEIHRRGDGAYVLSIPMPHVEADRVGLVKRADELIVEIGNIKRDVALPRALAEREAVEAEIRDGRLEVVFRPEREKRR